MAPPADAFVLPRDIPSDLFFAFWIPIVRRLDPGAAVAAMAAMAIALLVLPTLTARRGAARPAPSSVDQEVCTGCLQCSLDCPYGAIEMIKRTDDRPTLVASVDPSLCVSCGICAGSCAPMGVGPPGRGGRDQIAQVQAFLAQRGVRAGQVVAVCCDHGAAAYRSAVADEGAALYTVDCVGNLHTSVIELLLRRGAGGVIVLACQPRDCRSREGPRWLVERVHHGREAELQARVDRRRVHLVSVAAGERRLAVSALRAFAAGMPTPAAAPVAPVGELQMPCESLTGSRQ